MKLKLVIDEKDEANRMILICAIGLLDALEHSLMTIEESHQYLFNPTTLDVLKKEGIADGVIDIIKSTCELLEKKLLVTDKSTASYMEMKSEMKECLKKLKYDPDGNTNMKWLYRF